MSSKKKKKARKPRPPISIGREIDKAMYHHRCGQLRQAAGICRKILQVDPCHSMSWNLLGAIAHQSGELTEAEHCFAKAVEYNPTIALHHNNLGYALISNADFEKAIVHCRQALFLNPNLAQAHNNMGLGMLGLGDPKEALACFGKAIKLNPSYTKAYGNMALALLRVGRSDEAVSFCRKAISIDPTYVEAYHSLGLALHGQGKTDEAIASFQQAIDLKNDYFDAYKSLGLAFQDQGELELAESNFRKALNIQPDAGIEVRLAILLPIILESHVEAQTLRQDTIRKIESLEKQNLVLKEPDKEVGVTNFLFAYHGINDVKIQQRIASFYTETCPGLVNTSYTHRTKTRLREKTHVGFVSKHFFGHTVGELNHGIIKHLSRDQFTVTLFRFPCHRDHLAKRIDSAADRVVELPADLTRAREKIIEHAPDILFYPDIGMDALTYFLAFSRMAPVQCVAWGHPLTTGIPNIDYFLSVNDAEPDDAHHHYTEQLIRLESIGTYFHRPELPGNPASRTELGLSDDDNIYACPQSLFKFHPDFDGVLREILVSDPKGQIVLIDGKIKNWSRLLKKRFQRSFPEVADRVLFVPQMSHKDFLSFLLAADAVLDTIHFCGGKTSLEAFACNQPVVTLPGNFLRGRLTFAFCKQMGFMDCVASDTKSYVEIALRLANDKAWKDELTERIQQRSRVLYENPKTIKDLEYFFQQALAEKVS